MSFIGKRGFGVVSSFSYQGYDTLQKEAARGTARALHQLGRSNARSFGCVHMSARGDCNPKIFRLAPEQSSQRVPQCYYYSTTSPVQKAVVIPDDNESFKVIKITTKTGAIETMQLLQTEILQQTTLAPRDLVSLQLTTKKERRKYKSGKMIKHPPAILARNNHILLSLGAVRAVAEPDAVYVFSVHSKAAKDFAEYLSNAYRQRYDRLTTAGSSALTDEEPTELVFLEAVLADAVDSFTNRIRIFEPIVNDVLRRIANVEDVSDANLVHQMAPLMEHLKSFEAFVTQAYDCLTQLLNDDEAMLELLLTEQKEARKTKISVDFERHQDVEYILGIYARRFNSIIQEINLISGRIEAKQQFIELELDLYRNRLIRMNIDLAILATVTGVTTAITGTFGMNMINGLEESSTAFALVGASSAVTALSVGQYFRKKISGNAIQQRAEQRIDGIKTITNALSDMTALDIIFKTMLKGESMTKEEFRQQLALTRRSKVCTEKEADMLFNVLTTNEDDVLGKEDFYDFYDRLEENEEHESVELAKTDK